MWAKLGNWSSQWTQQTPDLEWVNGQHSDIFKKLELFKCDGFAHIITPWAISGYKGHIMDTLVLEWLKGDKYSHILTKSAIDWYESHIIDTKDIILGTSFFYHYIQEWCKEQDKSIHTILNNSQKKFLRSWWEFDKKDKIRLLLLESIIEKFSETEENIRKFFKEWDNLENVFNKTVDALSADLLTKEGDNTYDIETISTIILVLEKALLILN